MKQAIFNKLHKKLGGYLLKKGVAYDTVRKSQAVYAFVWSVSKILVAVFIAMRIFGRVGFEKTLIILVVVYMVTSRRR